MSDITELVTLLEGDDDVRRKMKELALLAIDEARDLLERGIPSIQMQVIRSLLPAMNKALAARDDRDLRQLKEDVASMQAAFRADIS